MKSPSGSSAEIEYPSSDGQPGAENGWQLEAMLDAMDVLRTHFVDRPGVSVSGDPCLTLTELPARCHRVRGRRRLIE